MAHRPLASTPRPIAKRPPDSCTEPTRQMPTTLRLSTQQSARPRIEQTTPPSACRLPQDESRLALKREGGITFCHLTGVMQCTLPIPRAFPLLTGGEKSHLPRPPPLSCVPAIVTACNCMWNAAIAVRWKLPPSPLRPRPASTLSVPTGGLKSPRPGDASQCEPVRAELAQWQCCP